MSTAKMAINRLITLLIAVLAGGLAALGVGLALDQSWARDAWQWIDDIDLTGITAGGSYNIVLLVAAIVTGILGLFIVLMNIERPRVGRQNLRYSRADGVMGVHPSDVAAAVAQDLERIPHVKVSKHIATRDRGERVLKFVVRAPADVNLPQLRTACERAQQDIVAALPGMEFKPRFDVHIDRVQR
ncbi:MAG TPA: hypothetical protein H9867_08335 [Candidatus Corynebacterium gallistercoris]|uniref:Alkaline shock response membrane anchor protein AmaP n=1 Tax=Candidatus Corynebacterium gallistercoris TaxID=2838530 RepID=A0A9D1RZ72_9CORY|nr:hypothetical protein [Candidatus Corynebacterium gallistercoris]